MHCPRMAQECREIDVSKSVHGLDHKSRPLAGTPAFVELNKRREEEGLFGKLSFKIVHDVTGYLNVFFCSCNLI